MRYLAIGWANVEKEEREVQGGGGEGERWKETGRVRGGER